MRPIAASYAAAASCLRPSRRSRSARGDIDEYTFTATAGDSVVGYFRVPLGAEAGDLMLEVLDPVSATVLATARISAGTFDLGPIPIAVTGTHMVRVRGGYPWGRGAYEFHLRIK